MTIGKKIALMVGAILMMSLLAVGIYLTTAYQFSTSELAKTFKDYRTSGQVSTAIKDSKPFSILLMGVDTGSESRREQWVGNSDSMILVTINPETKKTTVTSLERDILVELSGPESNESTGAQAKLNAAYASGGAEMALMTVEDLLDIKIDYYMQLNMKGLVDLVEAIGGITVTNDFNYPISIEAWEPEYTATVEPGTHKVNGEQALVYARMRYDDPEGDYGRQRRQRVVIEKILNKLLALDSVSSYRKILRAVSSNMQTDIQINASTIPSLLHYQSSLSNLKNYQLHGEDANLPTGSYQAVTAEHMLETQNRIKKELGLKTSKTLKTSAILYETIYGLETDVPLAGEESSGSKSSSIPSSILVVEDDLPEAPVVVPEATQVVEVPVVPVVTEVPQAPVVVETPQVVETVPQAPAPVVEAPVVVETPVVETVPIVEVPVVEAVPVVEVPAQPVQ